MQRLSRAAIGTAAVAQQATASTRAAEAPKAHHDATHDV